MDFGYGDKDSKTVTATTSRSIKDVEGVRIYSSNAFGKFLEVDAGLCNLNFDASTLGARVSFYYSKGEIEDLTTASYINHFKWNSNQSDITLLINHIMMEEDTDITRGYRNIIVDTLRRLGSSRNCAVPAGETAIMNTLKGIYLGLTSVAIDKSGSEYNLDGKLLILHADGVGTKTLVYKRKDYGFVTDALAMNLNDILVAGLGAPEKVFCCNNLIIGPGYEKDIEGIKHELERVCRERDVDLKVSNHVLMPNFKGVELDMTLTAAYDKKKIGAFNVLEGNVVVGVASSGIHSNGLTGARSYAEQLSDADRIEFYNNLAVPTLIYDKFWDKIQTSDLNGAVHVTGGAFKKILNILPENLAVYINRNHVLEPQNLFLELKKQATNERMYSYFNCGIGLVLVAKDKDSAERLVKEINSSGYTADVIGEVRKGRHEVHIESKFDDELVLLK